jgi:hypothetical protein
MPEWYVVIGTLAALSALGILWKPLLLALPLLAYAVGVLLVQASLSAGRASFASAAPSRRDRLRLLGLTTVLHLIQPLARLRGRWRYGLTPWRWRSARGLVWPWPRTLQLWSEQWQCPMVRLQAIEDTLRAEGTAGTRGGDYDRWDLEVRGGLFGAARLLATTEEHGAGRQLVRFRLWPQCSVQGFMLILVFSALAVGAACDQAWYSAAILLLGAVIPACRMVQECAGAMATVRHALTQVSVVEGA